MVVLMDSMLMVGTTMEMETTLLDDMLELVEIMKPSMIEEFLKENELPQATIEVEESVVLHIKEEISNEEHCDLIRDKNIEKESIEIKEKERVENKERLVERSCIFDSILSFEKREFFDKRNPKRNVDHLGIKWTACEELDLPPTVGPALTITGRFLDKTSFEDRTLPCPVLIKDLIDCGIYGIN
ncbi:hypothetical protein M9H77_22742 [Catharanthus roseus]|uniref:Uncharacterized protein n=1 Tax=Catharanthus roseus TaxID=4058 RepID=A0ACC0ATH1_CATRO|nr:hypothetical protein M9H77_22742 [Catharanthus roseus]